MIITALEAPRDKTHVLNLGMMQELRTGRIRLIQQNLGTRHA